MTILNKVDSFLVNPIGYFHTRQTKKYQLPRQAAIQTNQEGFIELNPHCQFEQALDGLEGFERIWIVFYFHLHTHWKPKVLPPRGGKKQGVFATRAPHRPNFLGLSCVELKSIQGLRLNIANHDLIDGTPILDIKPYLNYADSFQCQRQGWLEELAPEISYELVWSERIQQQLDYLEREWNCLLKQAIAMRLKTNPLPYPNNRVREIKKGLYQLAYQTWRIYYRLEGSCLVIDYLSSGYDEETLKGGKPSKWEDVPIHQAFSEQFKNQTQEK